MDLKKIFILEDECIIALDIKYILVKAGQYLPIIIKNKKDIPSLILDERPWLIIMSLNVDEKISKEIFFIGEKFDIRFILLSTDYQNDCNQKTNQGFYKEVIFKPFSGEMLIKGVEKLLQPPSPIFTEACISEAN